MRAAAALDTQVIDDPDAPPPLPVRARTGTDGALTMQVYIDDCWHRRTPDLAHTACALRIDGERNPPRREQLVEPLCRICFTAFEVSQAKGPDR